MPGWALKVTVFPEPVTPLDEPFFFIVSLKSDGCADPPLTMTLMVTDPVVAADAVCARTAATERDANKAQKRIPTFMLAGFPPRAFRIYKRLGF